MERKLLIKIEKYLKKYQSVLLLKQIIMRFFEVICMKNNRKHMYAWGGAS